MRRRMYGVLVVLGLTVSGLVASGPPLGAQGCYPGPNCAGGDAVTDAINAPPLLKVNRPNRVSVDGHEEQQDATVRVTVRASKRSKVRPRAVEFFVANGDRYTVVFRVRPMRRGNVNIRGCSAARPEDFDPSNNCLRTTSRAKNVR